MGVGLLCAHTLARWLPLRLSFFFLLFIFFGVPSSFHQVFGVNSTIVLTLCADPSPSKAIFLFVPRLSLG